LKDKESLDTLEYLEEGCLEETAAFLTTDVDLTPSVGSEIVAQFLDTTVPEFPTSVIEAGGVATSALIPGVEV
jgi:hypothetical protein